MRSRAGVRTSGRARTRRPDSAIAVYSGYSRAKDKDELAPGLRVPPGTPPVFLAHGDVMSRELLRAGVAAELHVDAGTTHDFGVRRVGRPCDTWTASCAAWLRHRGVVAGSRRRE